MVPVFLRAVDQSATAGLSMPHALFIAFHLLGQWREKSAYPIKAVGRNGLGIGARRPPTHLNWSAQLGVDEAQVMGRGHRRCGTG
jgi:hypothetical protein